MHFTVNNSIGATRMIKGLTFSKVLSFTVGCNTKEIEQLRSNVQYSEMKIIKIK